MAWRSKGAGEWAVRTHLPSASWVVRTAWLYGAHGPNFVKTMTRLVEAQAPFGIYHGTSSGESTWFGFPQGIFRLLGHDPAGAADDVGGVRATGSPAGVQRSWTRGLATGGS